MKKQTLLEKAKKISTKRGITNSKEDLEIALAWLKDEVTLGQVARVYGYENTKGSSGGRILYRFAVCFRELYRQGKMKI